MDEPVYLADMPLETFEPVVPARSVLINAQDIFLGVGDSFRLEARVLPENADNPYVSFSIASPNYCASVSSTGVVTGLAEGTTIVRIYAAEAPVDIYTECTVTVGSGFCSSPL